MHLSLYSSLWWCEGELAFRVPGQLKNPLSTTSAVQLAARLNIRRWILLDPSAMYSEKGCMKTEYRTEDVEGAMDVDLSAKQTPGTASDQSAPTAKIHPPTRRLAT
jgi:hypothetical protein